MKKYPISLIVVALAMVLAACSDTADTGTSASPEASETTTTTAAVTTTAPASTTAAPTTTTAPPETTTTTSTAAPTTTTTLPPFPAARVDLEHGGEAWVVVLGYSTEFGDPVLDAAVAAAEDAGYFAGPTDCDRGAAVALGLAEDASVVTVSIYLESEADAQAALAAFEARGVTGGIVAMVLTYCLD